MNIEYKYVVPKYWINEKGLILDQVIEEEAVRSAKLFFGDKQFFLREIKASYSFNETDRLEYIFVSVKNVNLFS